MSVEDERTESVTDFVNSQVQILFQRVIYELPVISQGDFKKDKRKKRRKKEREMGK